MKLLRVLELLSGALPLVFLLKFSSSNKVAALAKEATMKDVNNIDFYNPSSAHEGGTGLHGNKDNTRGVTRIHSRGKRFIAFPVGSSFSTAVCMTTGVIGNPNYTYLSMGLNWGIAYDLPNSTWVLQHANGFGSRDKEEVVSPQIKRRHRRELYGKLETLIKSYIRFFYLIVFRVQYFIPHTKKLEERTNVLHSFWLNMQLKSKIEKQLYKVQTSKHRTHKHSSFRVVFAFDKFENFLNCCCHTCSMAHRNNQSLSMIFFLLNKLNSFHLIKTFMIILVIYADFVKLKRTSNVAASENFTTLLSDFVLPHVVDDNDISAINNFNGNFFGKNQITSDTLQRRAHDTDDNDLLSLSVKSGTKTTNCGSKKCGTNQPTTSTTENSVGNRTKTTTATQQNPVEASTGMVMMTNTSTTRMSNVFFSSSVSQAASSSLSSPILLPSSPSSSLLLQQQRLLSRARRYLSFPEGSSFSVAVCFTVGIIGNPRYNYMSFGLNWGVAYDLPNTSWILNHLHGFAKRPFPVAVWHRRSRRSLYKEIENVVDNMGYNGRDCVLRALCESRQYFQKSKMGMIGEMLRVIFSLPKQRIFSRELTENSDIELYDRAYRKSRSIADCSEQYDCGFSLLELAFGKYSSPPDGYYTKH